METIFPTAPGFESLFFVGWHKSAANAVSRSGTVVVKRTYAIAADEGDPAAGTLTPAGEPLPVFMQDQPETLLANGDFEAGTDNWTAAAGVTIGQQEDAATGNHYLAVSGSANGRVTQTVDLGAPLRGRAFVLSFKARADAATSIANAQLEAGGQVICSVSTPLSTAWPAEPFTERGVWPNNLGSTGLTVVLRAAADAGRTVHYDDVSLGHIAYEHDLAADKPFGDLVVLPGQNLVPAEIQVNGAAWLRRPAANPNELQVFGWERRDVDPRKADAPFPGDPNVYPLDPPLPAAFNNRYYNGYRRDARAEVSASGPSHLPAAAGIRLVRSGADDYAFTLGGEALNATYYFYSGIGPDQESRWQPRSVAMNLDTLVIEPDDDRCYAVWRGVWEFDGHLEDSYRRLVVTNV